MRKTNVKGEQIEVNNVSMIRNMAVGYDEDSFVIAINKNEDDTFEGVYSIPVDKWNDIITMLFQAGVDYQQDTKVDIGFGIGESYGDESTD